MGNSLSQTIKFARSQLNLTQEQLAEMLGTSRSVVANWESGRTVPRADSYLTIETILSRTLKKRPRR